MDERQVHHVRPYVVSQRTMTPFACSNNPSRTIAGPSVIIRKSSDGGYFSQLTNESSVASPVSCGLQPTGSPYAVVIRSTTKPTTTAAPNQRRNDCLEWEAPLNSGPST